MEIGGIISAIVIGLIIGVLGRLALPGRQNISIILTILVGIVAALVGTALAGALDVSDTDGIDWIELGGDGHRLASWLGQHELPLRIKLHPPVAAHPFPLRLNQPVSRELAGVM